MWPLLALFFLAGIFAVHFAWRQKFRHSEELHKRALADLRENERKAVLKIEAHEQALFNSMVEGFLLLDNAGRIRLANRPLEKLFDVTSRIYGKTILEAFRNRQLAELAARLQHEPQILGTEIELAEIQPRWLHVNAAAIRDSAGNASGTVFVFHDLTRLKKLENTRQEFVANVSHELRTPLSMIKGFVETLLDGAKDEPEVAEKFLRTIEKHTDRLTFLIEDLLTISKLESGRVVLNRQENELRPLVEKIIGDLQSRAAEKNILLQNQIPPDFVATFDADRLQQVFWNLIENAVKYGKTTGTVRIGGEREEGKIRMWVKDDGPGIPEPAQARIFERFYRADKARSREEGGTGLGLAIVKHVVQAHGGEIWVESKPGEGSCFYFTLPIDSSAEKSSD